MRLRARPVRDLSSLSGCRVQEHLEVPLKHRSASGNPGPDLSVNAGVESDSYDAQLAEAALAIIRSQSEDDVYAVIDDFLTRLVPGVIVVINESTTDLKWLVTRRVAGSGQSLIARAAELLGRSIVGARYAVLPEYHDQLFGGALAKIPGGISGLASAEIARPVADAIGKMAGVRDVYTLGITDGERALGNLHIFTTGQCAELPTHVVETFVRHCFSALAGIRRARDLVDSAAHSALLIDSMVEGIALHEIILDDNGTPCDYRFLDVNSAFEEMTGLSKNDIVGRTARETLPRLEQSWIDRYGAVATTGVADRFLDYSADIGKHFDVTAYSPQSGQFVTVIEDITERQNADKALRDSERWLSESQRVAHLGHYNLDIQADRWEGSQALYDVLGTDEDRRADFDAWLDIVHPADRARMTSYFTDEVLGKRQPFDVEYRIVRPRDGVERWVHGLGTVDYCEDGQPNTMFGIIQDITEYKLLEMDLRESETQLKKAQHFARLGSWTWNIKTNQLDWSDEMFHLFGLDQATFTGDLADVISSAIHPDDRAVVEESNRSVMTEGRPIPVEYRVIRPDGSVHVVWGEAGEMLRDDDGNPAFLSGTVQDITERKRAEEEILRLNDDLERRVRERTEELTVANAELLEANANLDEATRAKSDFLTSMSHELRTPLNSIIGFSDILIRGLAGQLEPEQQKQVGMINTSGKYLLELINEVLDLSAIEAGQMRIEHSTFDVPTLVNAVAESLTPLAAEKGLTLGVEISPAVTTLVSDRVRLEQVLYNLLGNAIKFTDTGSVRVEVERTAEEMVFSFTDTGRGIAEEDLVRIFGEFYQVERHDIAKSQGTGLGLTVSTRLVELLGGSIDAESIHGAGSTFTVRLPAVG